MENEENNNEFQIKTEFTGEEKKLLDQIKIGKINQFLFSMNNILNKSEQMVNLKQKYNKKCFLLNPSQKLSLSDFNFSKHSDKLKLTNEDSSLSICLKNVHNKIAEYLQKNHENLNYCNKFCLSKYSYVNLARCFNECGKAFEKIEINNLHLLKETLNDVIGNEK